MDNLEKQIRTRREALDTFDPSEGHLDRFAEKLIPRRIPVWSRIPYAMKVAAAVLLVAASSIWIYEQVSHPGREFAEQNEVSMHLSDIEYYYTSLINEKYKAIDNFTSDDPEQNRILTNELVLMDSMYHSLQQDLQAYPTDERVINALISHYEVKLEVMEQILSQLEEVKQTNQYNEDENTEI